MMSNQTDAPEVAAFYTMLEALENKLFSASNDLEVLTQHFTNKVLPLVLESGGQVEQSKPRVLFCSPVTGKIEKTLNIWGLDWYDATGYGTYYTATGTPSYHTGADLNEPSYKDSGANVYAVADGKIVFSSTVSGWQGDVVVIQHTLEDGRLCWTRYAHIVQSTAYSYEVKRGDKIGVIADYNKDGPKGDHLHFDVSWKDLGKVPGDWPGLDLQRLKVDYNDPKAFLIERSK